MNVINPTINLIDIFDRFYHVEHPGKLFHDSIGIGLEFTQEIIELHKGKISVESEFGQGSSSRDRRDEVVLMRCVKQAQLCVAVRLIVSELLVGQL